MTDDQRPVFIELHEKTTPGQREQKPEMLFNVSRIDRIVAAGDYTNVSGVLVKEAYHVVRGLIREAGRILPD